MQLDSLQFLGIGKEHKCVYWGCCCERRMKRRFYLAIAQCALVVVNPAMVYHSSPASRSSHVYIRFCIHYLGTLPLFPDFLLAKDGRKLPGKSPIKKGSTTRDVGVLVDLRICYCFSFRSSLRSPPLNTTLSDDCSNFER
jgi:hypothetical protein